MAKQCKKRHSLARVSLYDHSIPTLFLIKLEESLKNTRTRTNKTDSRFCNFFTIVVAPVTFFHAFHAIVLTSADIKVLLFYRPKNVRSINPRLIPYSAFIACYT